MKDRRTRVRVMCSTMRRFLLARNDIRTAATLTAVGLALKGHACLEAAPPVESSSGESSTPLAPSIDALIRRKRSELAAALELEARRLQHVFKEVEREAAAQRDMEVFEEEEVFQQKLAAICANKRDELSALRTSTVAEAEDEARREAQEELVLYEDKARKQAAATARARIEAAEKAGIAEIDRCKSEWAKARQSVEQKRLSQVIQLESEVAELLARLEAKATEAATQAAIHKQTALLMRVVFALSSHGPVQGSIDDLAADGVVRAALYAVPVAARKSGVPQFDQLEERFLNRVEPALREWLLVPQDLDNGILAHFLASMFAAAGFSTPPLALDAKPDPEPMRLLAQAKGALVQEGDLMACIDCLAALPAKRDPNPAQDWIKHAKARLLADRATVVLRSKIALLNAQQLAPPNS